MAVTGSPSGFDSELAKYAPGVHILNAAANEDDLRAVEETLRVALPPSFRGFLQRSNGASLFRDSIVLFGTPSARQPNAVDLVRANQQRWPGMPAECLIIGSFSYGDEICYLRVDSQGQKTELALWDHELGKFVESWPSFAALLDDLMVIGGRAFNYDGTHRRFAMESLVSAIKNIFRRK